MKLAEIKPLKESVIPIHLTMILQEVIDNKKVTNTAQYLILAQVVQLFKFAPSASSSQIMELTKFGPYTSPRYMYENPTPKQLLDELKALPAEDQVKLAIWCLEQLAIEQTIETTAKYCNPQMALTQWVSWVCQAQK